MAEADWARVVDLEAGVAMVVTDLHGDWDAYCRLHWNYIPGYITRKLAEK